ncbi:MAG TPA: UDP-glucose/GDP-mannose dehydrogenase family protein [Candidatus Polarisedimenticolia bacterium]|nr:UDP-glucose/GDP-mannose dehydrogenase family protein [Candidatus Polarisedimenticolia bacterium]
MNIAVVGTGYVGLVTGACFAEFGVSVIGVDKDEAKIAMLRQGKVPFFEPGLEELVARNMREDRLTFTTDLKGAVEQSLVILIAVGTPPGADGGADLKFVREVAKGIALAMNGYKVVVTKSTVPTGTGEMIRRLIQETQKQPVPFSVASNPEFLREGSAIEDFMRPNRIVIGAEDPQAIAILKDLYNPLYLIETPLVVTNVVSAEMIKYASNAFLATKISFINEMALLCDAVGADVHEVARGMGLDNRIGKKFLHPGPGYGGSCFPKDTLAVLKMAKERGLPARLVSAVVAVNDEQIPQMVAKITRAVDTLKGKKLAVLGLSFKPNTSDTRESPAIRIIEEVVRAGATVRAYDPAAMDEAKHALPAIEYAEDAYDAARGCDALVIATEWNQFRNLDWDRMRQALKSPVVIDLRNVYDPRHMRELGLKYVSVGRPA